MKSSKLCWLIASMVGIASTAVQAEEKSTEGPTLGQAIVKRFDTNGNGRIDPEESEAAKAELGKRGGNARGAERNEKVRKAGEAILKRFDANGNGKLEPAEREAAKKATQKNRAAKGKGKAPAKGKAAQARKRANAARRAALVKEFDTNGDGRLNEREMKAAKAELEKLRGK